MATGMRRSSTKACPASTCPPTCTCPRKDKVLSRFSPEYREPLCRGAMGQITSVESGHMLLKGSLRFIGSGFDYTVRYNTRGYRSVFRFMRRFRDELLRGALPLEPSPVCFGSGLDVKFANALAL